MNLSSYRDCDYAVFMGYYRQATYLMDDDIREELHETIGDLVDEPTFLWAYCKEHLAKYGEVFSI